MCAGRRSSSPTGSGERGILKERAIMARKVREVATVCQVIYYPRGVNTRALEQQRPAAGLYCRARQNETSACGSVGQRPWLPIRDDSH